MGRIFFGAKAKAWREKRNVVESRPIKAVSDNGYIVPLKRLIGERTKRVWAVAAKAKLGIDLCEHCRWSPPTPSILHAHHVFPLACGGPDTLDNLLVLCPNCHATAHYVTQRSNLMRQYSGPKTREQLREWMSVAHSPRKLRALQQAYVHDQVRPLIESLRPLSPACT